MITKIFILYKEDVTMNILFIILLLNYSFSILIKVPSVGTIL